MATKTIYFAAFMDEPCGHAHTTFNAAELCASKTLRRARKEKTTYHFPHPDLIQRWAKEGREAAEFVKSHVLS